MGQSEYSKHKDQSPQETVFKIQSILNDAGLFPVTQWVKNPRYSGARSNRVTLFPSRMGANGKGTDEIYAAASGHAELMERMENGLLSLHFGLYPFLEKNHGFFFAPDEKLMDIDEIAEAGDRVSKFIFDGLGFKDRLERKDFLRKLLLHQGKTDSRMPTIPFVDMAEGDVKWLPFNILRMVYASNGMASGNTMEEAMVQAISEIFERYVNYRLMAGEVTPPRIPDEVLQAYSFWPLIEAIRAEGDYEISFYDCSLGKGYPVVGCIIVNKNTGTFGLRLGSHPSFAVAVERTLTEAMQGRSSIEDFTRLNRVGTFKEAKNFHNPSNVSKVGRGLYSASLFLKEPDWEFVPWKEWEGLDNRGFLRKMLSLIKKEGCTPFVRDASFLGFPACFIIVPGMSHIFPVEPLTARAMNTAMKFLRTTSRFPRLTAEEEKALLKLIRFRRGSSLENELHAILQFPFFGKRMNSECVGGFLAYKSGDLPLALDFFGRLLRQTEDESERRVLAARLDYLRYLQKGFTREEAVRLIRRFFREEVAEKVIKEMAEPETVMERLFPTPNCPDCEHCELRGTECDEQELSVSHKIWAAMKKGRENVSQEKLLKFLEEIVIE